MPLNRQNSPDFFNLSNVFSGISSFSTNLNNTLTRLNQPAAVQQASATPSAVSAPPKADAAPNNTTNNVYTGLCQALNDWQKTLKEEGKVGTPDIYKVEFATPELANAKVKKPGGLEYSATPMQQNSTGSGQLDPSRNSVNANARTVPLLAGTQIVQFMDQQIRASTYITDQLTYQISETTGQQIPNAKNNNGQTAWYKINMMSVPYAYDEIRRDNAYEITYVISPYAINTMQSEYFNDSKFRGVHKSYNYWFTGQNTQVIDYTQNINALYSVVMSGKQPINAQKVTGREQISRVPMTASGQSDQGAANAANEAGANGADYLYSFTDLATIDLKLIGDPAWLQQGEASGSMVGPFNFNPFNNDGTINFDASQITFEVLWNSPTDYDHESGIVPVTSAPKTASGQNQPQERATYLATECTSTFRQGKFEQLLKGTLIPQQVVNNGATSTSASASNTSASASANTAGTPAAAPAPLTAASVVSQLSIPTVSSIGNALGAVGNFIRNPFQAYAPDGRITQTAPTSSLTNPATPVSNAPTQAAGTPGAPTSNGTAIGIPAANNAETPGVPNNIAATQNLVKET